MFKKLVVKNITLLEQITIEFQKGFTLLTGSSGSGKSLFLYCLSLAFGEKPRALLVRPGTQKGVISLSLSINGEELVLQREFFRARASFATVNGKRVSGSYLKALKNKYTLWLQQHSALQIQDPLFQRNMIDCFGSLYEEKLALKKAYENVCEIKKKLDTLAASVPMSAESLESILADFALVDPTLKDFDHLKMLSKRLHQKEEALLTLTEAMGTLKDSPKSLISVLYSMERRLDPIARPYVPQEAYTHLQNANILLEEAASSFQETILSFDAEIDISAIENRLDAYHELARKYKVEVRQLEDFHQSIIQQHQALFEKQDQQNRLQNLYNESLSGYHQKAQALSLSRQKVSKNFSTELKKQASQLDLPQAQCQVKWERDCEKISEHGYDTCELWVSFNPGLPPQPLRQVASGGELARLSLACILITQDPNQNILILDEIDSGLGLDTAKTLGKCLQKFAQHNQVIAISHSPVLVHYANDHWVVEKDLTTAVATTHIYPADALRKKQELERLSGA